MRNENKKTKIRARALVRLGALATVLVSLAGCVVEPLPPAGPPEAAYYGGPAYYAAPVVYGGYYGYRGGYYHGGYYGHGYGHYR
jgi:hypothetical protein